MPKPFPEEFRRDLTAVAGKGEAPLATTAKDFGPNVAPRNQVFSPLKVASLNKVLSPLKVPRLTTFGHH